MIDMLIDLINRITLATIENVNVLFSAVEMTCNRKYYVTRTHYQCSLHRRAVLSAPVVAMRYPDRCQRHCITLSRWLQIGCQRREEELARQTSPLYDPDSSHDPQGEYRIERHSLLEGA